MATNLAEKYGIKETKKALEAAGGSLIGLKDIEWSVVARELADLDSDERKELFLALSEVLIRIIGFAQEYKSIIRLIIKFI